MGARGVMSTIRPPAVAGSFYPAQAKVLSHQVRALLTAAQVPAETEAVPKAVIAPHAGYIYSGPIAASAYAHLTKARPQVRRVILVGPAHRMGFQGIAAPQALAFASPLGEVSVDQTAIQSLVARGLAHRDDRPHALEHSLEVHLPFLQQVFTDFTLAPLAIGEADPEQVAAVLETLWGGLETQIVVSSDLSHYLDYASAQALDRVTTRAIEMLQDDAIGYEQACGRHPIQGLLRMARKRGLKARTVDLRNSGDTAGARDRVVGYGAYVFS